MSTIQSILSKLKNVKRSGTGWTASCPAHDDEHNSLSISEGNDGRILIHCHAGCNLEAVLSALEIGVQDLFVHKRKTRLTIEEYAEAKKLPVEFLSSLGVKNTKTGISIPYMDESGAIVATRTRYSISGEGLGVKFAWVRGSKILPYGVWKLNDFRKAGYVILVEGESDAQTLWHYNMPALGIPGATSFQLSWVQYLTGLKIYVHKEPDAGGEAFIQRICQKLVEARWEGEVSFFQLPGYKDPSELHCADPDNFSVQFKKALAEAQPIDIRKMAVKLEEIVPGAPFQPRIPAGWRLSLERGLQLIKDEGAITICPVPLILSKRLHSIDTDEEKVEISFYRDNQWHRITASRSTVFKRQSIPLLADRGLPITSENASKVVQFLGELEGENLDLLPIVRSVSRLGWLMTLQFMPGAVENILLDVDEGLKNIAEGLHEEGEFETWKSLMMTLRSEPIARFVLAASFASVLQYLVGHRVFVVHMWGPSRGGKTAILKAALSVWGEPEMIMANFYATKVGLERLASFFCDLPLGIDERQVMGDKQNFIESLIYLLGTGKGKARGAKSGGLQHFGKWRMIILTTGEDPLTASTSGTGVYTRILELYGSPIQNESLAQEIHIETSKNYGHAGLIFVKSLIGQLKEDSEMVVRDYLAFVRHLQENMPKNLGSHITAVAIVCLADYYASQWVFSEDEEISFRNALSLAETILKMLELTEEADFTERAREFVLGWLTSYAQKFEDGCPPPRYGFKSEPYIYVIPSVLENALKQEGFSPRRVLRDFAVKGWIETTVKGGKHRYKIWKYWENEWLPFIIIRPSMLKKEEMTEEDEMSDRK